MAKKLGTKTILAVLVALGLCVGAALLAPRQIVRQPGLAMTVQDPRAMVVEAENVRESISRLEHGGAFDRRRLLGACKASGDRRGSTLYRTLPVVASWTAVRPAATGSGEQSRSVAQINPAVTRMDKVPRPNANSTEETSTAATQLYAQAAALKSASVSLHGIIDTTRIDGNGATPLAASRPVAVRAPQGGAARPADTAHLI